MEQANFNSVFSPITQNEKADIYGHLSQIPTVIKKIENIRQKCKNITDLKDNTKIKDLIYRLTLLINDLNKLQRNSTEMTYQKQKINLNSINAEYKKLSQKQKDLFPLQSYDLPDVFMSIEIYKEINERLTQFM